jgi:outer membrane lipopolysaccharide assembly protein LptE/RlpB
VALAHRAGMQPVIRALSAALVLTLAAQTAQAACEVEYKAKRDTPFELFYDVTTVDAPCSDAESALRARLARQGLTLLKILSKRER